MTATRSLRTKAPLASMLCDALLTLSAPALFTLHPIAAPTRELLTVAS